MTMEFLAVFLMAVGTLAVLWGVLGLFFRPWGKIGTLQMVLRIHGEDLRLEHQVRCLLWMRTIFGVTAEMVIWDDGMSEETRQIARRLAESCHGVQYQENGEETDEGTTG